ncbi:MAG: flavodoxin family protein, partial [Spirochaeta sp.]|nr:flavodoxin family protein [Spirochaeta sp.]
MKVLLVGGSPRAKGNTDILLSSMQNELERNGLSTTLAFLRDYTINPCIGCEQCRTDKTCTRFLDGMHLLYPEIESAEGLVLASPTYNYNITPMTKAFIDRMYPYFNFSEQRPGPYSSRLADRPRVAVTLGICEQNEASEMGVTMP